MFRGRSVRSLDPKGRLMLPPEYRDQVFQDSEAGRLILTNYDTCVYGYPLAKWSEIETSFEAIKNPDRQIRDFIRFFIGGAHEVEMDRQGRVLVPPSLREYAGLGKDVSLVGVGRHFEIWDAARLKTVSDQDFSAVFEAIAGRGMEVGI